jgi:hypothetical protein
MLLGKLDICMQKTETRSMSFTLYKYQVKGEGIERRGRQKNVNVVDILSIQE